MLLAERYLEILKSRLQSDGYAFTADASFFLWLEGSCASFLSGEELLISASGEWW